MAKPVEVTEQTFDQSVLKADEPVLVDFWAPWCAPCRHLAPIVEELAGDYDGKVTFTKLNVDEAPNIAVRYGIMSIPTLAVFRDGKAVDGILGAVPKSVLKGLVEKHVSAASNTMN